MKKVFLILSVSILLFASCAKKDYGNLIQKFNVVQSSDLVAGPNDVVLEDDEGTIYLYDEFFVIETEKHSIYYSWEKDGLLITPGVMYMPLTDKDGNEFLMADMKDKGLGKMVIVAEDNSGFMIIYELTKGSPKNKSSNNYKSI
jgi:hypothetical protein